MLGSWKLLILTVVALIVGCTAVRTPPGVRLTQDPRARAAFKRGVEAGMEERHEQAFRAFEEAVRFDPNFSEAHRLMGFALISLGRAEEAIPHYREALRISPEHPAAWTNLAAALGATGNPEAGLEAYRRGISLDPGLAATDADIERQLREMIDAFLPIGDPTRPFELDGFRVMPPTGEHWRVLRGATDTGVTFVRNTPSSYHTAVASATLTRQSSGAGSSEAFLRQVSDQGIREFEDPRYADLRSDVTDTRAFGLSCQRISFTVEDHKVPWAPGEVFVMRGWDLYCLHPQSTPATVLRLAHSQRYRKGGQPLALDAELGAFSEGVAIVRPSR